MTDAQRIAEGWKRYDEPLYLETVYPAIKLIYVEDGLWWKPITVQEMYLERPLPPPRRLD